MPRSLRLLTVTLIALTMLLPFSGAAQEASPPAGAASGPNLGDRVRVEDFDHNEVAAVTVTKIDDPSPEGEAEAGFRLVRIEVSVENVGTESFDLEGYQFAIVDTNGFIYDSDDEFLDFDRLDDPNASAGFGGFEPGQALGGPITIQIPADAQIAQVVFAPSERTIPLVDLRTSRPAYDTAVPVFDTAGATLATIAISAPTDPYEPPPSDSSFVLNDERYLTFATTIQNTGAAALAVDPRDFWVLDTHGYLIREQPAGELESDPTSPFLQPNDALAAGESATGLIEFLLPNDSQPVAIVYAPLDDPAGDRFLSVAESGLAIPAPTSAPLFTTQAAAGNSDVSDV